MSYVLAEIDSGGYIYGFENSAMQRRMVHRETLHMNNWPACLRLLKEAKVHLTPMSPMGNPMIILGLREDGGVSHVWTTDENRPAVTERLRTWRTCYGAWPVRRLN